MKFFKNSKNIDIPESVPCIHSKDRVIFPKMMIPIELDSTYKELCEFLKLNKGNAYIVVSETSTRGSTGTLCKFLEMYSADAGRVRLLLSGKCRVIIKDNPVYKDGIYFTEVSYPTETGKRDDIAKALVSDVLDLFEKILIMSRVPKETLVAINSYKNDTGAVCDLVAHAIDIRIENKYKILECIHIPDRIVLLIRYMEEFIEILNTAKEISKETRENLDKRNKEYYLRSEREVINKKLGEDDSISEETNIYEKKIEEKGLPEEALKEAQGELKRMKRMHPASHEYSIIATYLDWMLDLPWNDSTEDILDIKSVREKLDNDHYGLEKPKKRILEYLAIRKLNPESRSPILCLVGAAGTGKTSICKSIADSMGRTFQRMSLGGVRDEAVIRGFKRTYIGSMPGRIIQALKRAGTNNPIITLDEIDKLGADHRGDPSSALLEALDPEQNNTFNDHYLNVSFDLSKVIFIATANFRERIPAPLLDRMEIINFAGYSQDEKEKIANQFLIPKQLKEHGLQDIKFTKKALDEIINGYTREAGVRNLEREIANIIRGVGCEFVETDLFVNRINKKEVTKYLGVSKYPDKDDISITKPGVSICMYYSEAGGSVGFCEVVGMRMFGEHPKITASGNLKDVIKESIEVAMNWIRSNCKDLLGTLSQLDKIDIHVHFPEGAVPKDGPSAGTAILVALVSLFSNKTVKDKTAFTGEITLRGKVLPIGGIKEKVIGAHRAGIRTVVLPSWNRNQLDKIPADIKKDITFHFVNTMNEVLDVAFGDS